MHNVRRKKVTGSDEVSPRKRLVYFTPYRAAKVESFSIAFRWYE